MFYIQVKCSYCKSMLADVDGEINLWRCLNCEYKIQVRVRLNMGDEWIEMGDEESVANLD